jgi:hypothetical protein
MVIPHFCRKKVVDPETGIERTCGKTNPEDFNPRRKGICKTCRSHANNILNKTKNQKSKEVINLEKKEEELKEIQIKTIKLKSKLELETEANVLNYFMEIARNIPHPELENKTLFDFVVNANKYIEVVETQCEDKIKKIREENKILKEQVESQGKQLENLTKLIKSISNKINQ